MVVLCARGTYECCTSAVQGAILRTKTALGYRESHAAPIAFADLPRLDFALHFALTGVERERDAPCSTLAPPSLRISAPRSSYHSNCIFAQLISCHDMFNNIHGLWRRFRHGGLCIWLLLGRRRRGLYVSRSRDPHFDGTVQTEGIIPLSASSTNHKV